MKNMNTGIWTKSMTTSVPQMPHPIELTADAAEQVKVAMQQEGLEGHAVRVAVVGGGCSGLQYFLDFTEGATTEQDLEYESHGVRVVIDCFSAAHLMGTEIDFVDTISGTGFKFNNPNLVRRCGCGMSFST